MSTTVSKQWEIEEQCSNSNDRWGVVFRAARHQKEELLGIAWTNFDEVLGAVHSVMFDRKSAIHWMRTLYSAFTALDDPESYLAQLGLAMPKDVQPTTAVVGSAEFAGGIQMIADWSSEQRGATITIVSEKGQQIQVCFGREGIAHLAQVTEQAFYALDWDIPD